MGSLISICNSRMKKRRYGNTWALLNRFHMLSDLLFGNFLSILNTWNEGENCRLFESASAVMGRTCCIRLSTGSWWKEIASYPASHKKYEPTNAGIFTPIRILSVSKTDSFLDRHGNFDKIFMIQLFLRQPAVLSPLALFQGSCRKPQKSSNAWNISELWTVFTFEQ